MKKILNKLKNPLLIKLAIFLGVIVVVLGPIYYYLKFKQNRVLIEDSLVSATVIPVTSTTTGKLRQVVVTDGQKVKKGDLVGVVGSELVRTYNDGLIIETNKLIGATISPATPLVKVLDQNEVRIVGTIDENKGLSKIKLGQVASFTIDALPGKVFWGYVDEIAQSAKATSLTFSISSERPTQQFEVYIRFPAQNYPEIKNGMSSKMTVYTASL